MKRNSLKNMIKNKYSHLLIALIAFFFLSPLLNDLRIPFPISHFLFLVIMLFTLRVLSPSKRLLVTMVCLACVAFIFDYIKFLGSTIAANKYIITLSLVAYIVFIGIILAFLTKNVFSERSINADTIKGGISIYLLIGFWWALLYYLVMAFNPDAFVYTIGEANAVDLYSFSFTTLTTVGYGDTVPKSDLAVALANMEAVAGQIYLTVFVARLVGLHIVRNYKD